MKGAVEGDDFVLVLVGRYGLSDLAGKLQRCLVGFGTAIADECVCGIGHASRRMCQLNKLLGQQASVGVVIEVGSVDKATSLYSS